VAANGRLAVQRDAATRRLPRTPPVVDVEVDGRRYTVRYQNLLPKLSVHWPSAPSAASYVLQVSSPHGQRLERSSAQPTVTLASGELGEGVHELSFRAGTHSVRGSIRIAFDNTASTAYLSAPADGAPKAGERTRLVGAALQGSWVTVGGRTVALAEQGRFATDVTLPAEAAALVIRVQHASTGVHYYLRRIAR
jgi:hypothetical protein